MVLAAIALVVFVVVGRGAGVCREPMLGTGAGAGMRFSLVAPRAEGYRPTRSAITRMSSATSNSFARWVW